MKRQVLIFVMLLASLLPYSPSRAQSFTGAELTYTWVSDSTYTINLTLHSPCDSSYILPPSANICYFNSCNSITGTIPLSLAPQIPPFAHKHLYTGSITLPSRCDYWTFHGTVGRMPSLNLSAASGIYVEATLNNLDAQTSSSPLFTIDPQPWLCLNQPDILLSGPQDPDNDSIMVESAQSRTASGSIFSNCSATPSVISYVPPFTFFNPVNSPNGYVVDPNTGTAYFTPINLGYQSYAVRINKYRRSDGKKLGSVMRDAQFSADTCTAPTPNIGLVPNSFVGCQLSAGTILANANTAFTFCVYSTGNGGILSLTTTAGSILPGAAVTYTNTASDSIVGCLSFSPSLADTGNYTLIFIAKDSNISMSPCGPFNPIVLQMYLVAFIRIDHPLSLNNPGNTESIAVFPNPSSGYISIRSSIPVSSTILSLDGRTILENTTDESIDIRGIIDGIYLIQIRDKTGRLLKMEKLIKGTFDK